MQNKYACDVADFGKHGLLRFLSGLTDPNALQPDLSLAVAWYFHLDRCDRQDGNITGFLQDTPRNRRSYGDCDTELWNTLRALVEGGRRCVHCAEAAGLPIPGTLYHRELLHFPKYTLRPTRENLRTLWFTDALCATEGADLVCVDPDNGVDFEGQERYRKKGPKFAYEDELMAFFDRGQSLVIFHQLGRGDAADRLAQEAANRLYGILEAEPITLRFCRGPSRAFFVVPNPRCPEVAEKVRERTCRFIGDCWQANRHFRILGPQVGP